MILLNVACQHLQDPAVKMRKLQKNSNVLLSLNADFIFVSGINTGEHVLDYKVC